MSIVEIPQRFSQRWDTAANWAAKSPILWVGELGFESDTLKWKRGDGVSSWNDLAYVGGGGSAGDIVTPSGTSYTPVLADDGNTIISGSASAFALTLPTNATVPLRVGAKIAYTQGGIGQVTVAGATGVTVRAPNGNVTGAPFDGGVAEKIGTDEWQLWNGPALGPLATATDAPSDGKIYGRENGAWVEATGGSGGGIAGVNEQTGTTYTLALADAAQAVRCTNAAAIALTIPAHATVALQMYCMIPVLQGDAGGVTIAGASGVTLESPNGAATTDIGDFRVLFQRAVDIWVIG